MSYQLPKKLQNLQAYRPVTGEMRVRLDANESFLSLPGPIRREIAERVSRIEFNRYPDPNATELRARFAEYFGVKPELVAAFNGSDELLFLLAACFADAGEVLLTLAPDFSMYGLYGELAGLRVERCGKRGDLSVDVEAVIEAAREKQARLLIFSNPCNPSSLVESRADVLRIVEGLPDTLVAVDEAYMEFAEGSVLGDVERYNNLLVAKTFSKAFGLAGARLGFAVSNRTVTGALQAARSPYNVNAMSQAVGCILLDHPEYLAACRRQILESRDALFRMLRDLAGRVPAIRSIQNTHTNFVYMEVEGAEEVQQALRAQGISVRRMGGCLRICAGSEAENAALLAALEAYWGEEEQA